MFTGRTLSRLFRRNNKKHTPITRPLSRWNRCRLNLDLLEDRRVPATITVTGNSDANAVDGQVSLREAIISINSAADINGDIAGNITGTYGVNDEVIFNGAMTISVNVQMSISKAITITGLGASSITLQNVAGAGASSRIFDLNVASVNAVITMSGMTLKDGNLSTGTGNLGGAIRNANESVTLTNMKFSNNTASGQNTTSVGVAAAGGAIAMTGAGGVLNIDSCTFTGNLASGTISTNSGSGGAIVLTNSTTVTINNSSFNGNTANQIGGVLQVSGNSTAAPTPSSVKIDNSTFGTITTNRATSTGGAINVAVAAAGSTIEIGSSTFTANTSSSTGGVINLATTTTLNISDSSFSQNSSSSNGGVLASTVASTVVTINDSTFTSNRGSGNGGVISAASATINVAGSTFSNNIGPAGGVFRITGTTSIVSITLSTFTGNTATSGGGVLYMVSAANATISSTTFSGNSATGTGGALDLPGGTVTIDQVTFDSNKSNSTGGAIHTTGGSMTITNTTFNKNSGTSGGALNSSSLTASITGSTFSNNSASTSGGAILFTTGNITLTNSTLTGNTANGSTTTTGGGAIMSSSTGTLTVNNSTIVHNTLTGLGLGGAIRRSSTSATTNTLISTIVGKNSDGSGNEIYLNTAANILGGANLVGVADIGNFTLDTGSGANVTGTFASAKDPLVGPLANYGGVTLTHKLLPGSEALDAGKQNGFANDQTGAARPADPNADIGAVEGFLSVPQAAGTMPGTFSTAGANTFTVTVHYTDEGSIDTTTLDEFDVQITGKGYSSPETAIGKPSLGGSGGSVTATYTFYAAEGNTTSTWDVNDNGIYTVTLAGSQVSDNDTPTANAALTKTLGTFKVSIPQILNVNVQSDIDDGDATNGFMSFREALNLSNLSVGALDTINFDTSAFDGTPIVLAGPTLTITDSVIINGPGKAKFVLDGNDAKQIINISGTGTSVTMSGATLTKGRAATGAAIQMTNQILSVSEMDFTNGSATTNGGAIALTTGNLTVTSSNFSNNSATGDGGSIYASSTATLNVNGSQFTNNTAGSEGSAIYQTASGTTTTVNQSLFKSNSSNDAVIYSGGSSKLIVSKSQFEGNTATSTSSGIVHFLASATGEFNDTTFHSNTVSGDGIIWATTSTVTFNQATFTKNQGKLSGAIYHSSSGSITFHNSTIVGNTATGSSTAAGGIYLLSAASNLTLQSTIVAGNVGLTTDDIYSLGGVNISGNNNLIGLQFANWTATGVDNQIGPGTALDPGVNALADNGGFKLPDGSTILTMATKSGGLAIGKGNNDIGNTYDQRGGDDTGPLTDYPRSLLGNTDVGAYQTPPGPIPQASAKANNVTSPGDTTFTVTVTFSDDIGVNVGTIDISDVQVRSAIGGTTITASGLVTSPTIGFGNPVTATYTFNAPGGGWDAPDTDLYSVWIVGTVSDGTPNNVVSPAKLTSFTAELGAKSLTVSQLGDNDDGDYSAGNLTLREAVNFSNLNAGVDTILFGLPANSTITPGGVLALADSVNITGLPANPSNTTISGNDSVQIFNIAGAGTSVTMSGLTLANGKASTGGAIQLTTQSLTLSDMVLKNNSSTSSGGAVYASSTATLTVLNSRFSNNTGTLGGAIYLGNGSLSIDPSLFEGNRGSTGGVIYASGSGATVTIDQTQFKGNTATTSGIVYMAGSLQTLNVTDSTFADNSVTTSGGGIYIASTTTATIKQSTFSQNRASTGGAIFATTSSGSTLVTIDNSTIVGNTATSTSSAGGIHIGSSASVTLTMNSTIVADNSGPTTNDIYNGVAGYNIGGDYNLIGLQYTNWTAGGPNNQIGAFTPLASGVNALADNGGFTLPDGSKILTMATQPNGPAWFKGSNTFHSFANDQRGTGFDRAYAGFTDVGAYQHQVTNPEAIAKANNVTSPGGTTFDVTVTFVDNVNVDADSIQASDVVVKSAFTGATLNATTVSVSPPTGLGNPVVATFTFNAPNNDTIGAWDPSDTGAYNVLVVGSVTDNASNPVTTGQSIGSFGAYLGGKSMTVTLNGDTDNGDYSVGDLTLREAVNFSNANTGNVDTISFNLTPGTTINLGSTLGLLESVDITGPGKSNLTISGQSAVQIFNVSGASTSVSMSSVTLTQGRAVAGAAIQLTTQTVTLNSMDLTDGSATSNGGAIAMTSGTLTLTNTRLMNNSSTASGGGIYGNGTIALTVTDSQLIGNTSNSTGGAIFMSAGTTSITTSILSSNRSTAGGGIYGNTSNATINILNSYFTANTATGTDGGGGAMLQSAGTLTITNSTFEGNTASSTGSTSGGGAISVEQGPTTITNSTFNKNVGQVGGAIRSASNGPLTVSNSTIVGNTGIGGAGGVHFTGTSSTTLTAHTFQSTIVAANTGVNGPDMLAGSTASTLGFTINGDNNIIGYDHTYVPYTGTGNQLGLQTPIDPGVNPIGNNGGFLLPDGSTIRTMSLKSTSTAIDKGNTTGSPGAFDQRGTPFARTKWLATDVGAYEYAVVVPIAVGVANTVTTGGGTTYDVTVTFADDANVDAGTVDVNDVKIKSYLGGVTYTATTVTVSPPTGNGNPVTATYTFNAPGGTWGAEDQDLYEILVTGTVSDADTPTNNVALGKIGAFGAAFVPVSLVVDENSDVDDGNYNTGKLSLREALLLANGNDGQTDSITFNLPSGSTITLTSHQIISDAVSITGPGANHLTINANQMGRHFTLTDGNMVVSISGMKLINGFAPFGGSIQWTGSDTLNVDRVWFDGNEAPYGFLTVNGGGAIGGVSSVSGNISIMNSTFSNNSAFLYGGAIVLRNNTTFTISNSTFSGNNAPRGGAIGGPMSGGALIIKNSTITGNTAANSSIEGGGGIFLADSTISIGIMNIESSIIAGNVATLDPDIRGYSPTDVPWFTMKNSIIGKHTDGIYTDVGGASFVGSIASPVDPLLNSLANNGGPMPTHSLQGGSQAINAGTNPDTLTFDQRGTPYARSVGNTDMGAYEVQPPVTVTSAYLSDASGLTVNHRSLIKTLVVTFSQPVTYTSDAFTLFRSLASTSAGANDTVAYTVSPAAGNLTGSVTLTFSGAMTEFGSLIDGIYDFTIDASKVSSPDGALDGDGVGGFGGNYVVAGSLANKWFRYFGDFANDQSPPTPPPLGQADGALTQYVDFIEFRNAFTSPSLIFDWDNDGTVDQDDFIKFRNNFGGAP